MNRSLSGLWQQKFESVDLSKLQKLGTKKCDSSNFKDEKKKKKKKGKSERQGCH